MGKPWEKFQKPDAPPDGPWNKFAMQTGRESGTLMDQVPDQSGAEAPQEGILDRLKGVFTSAGRDKLRAAADQQSAEDLASRKSQSARGTGLAQTELEQGANALTLGYLPQIEAGVGAAMGDDYLSARDANVKRLAAQQEEHPAPSLAGTIGGGLLNAYLMPVPTVFKGAGMLSKVAQGALTGGLMGAAVNPGDKEGVIDPVQGNERMDNAESGAAFGAKIAGGAALGQKAAGMLGKIRPGAQGAAFKSSGAMLKDFRVAAGKDQIGDIGQFMLDKGIVEAGDTYETVAQKAKAVNADAGRRLDEVYSKAAKGPPAPGVGLDIARDKDAILKAASDDLGNAEGKGSALKRLGTYLDERLAELGSGVLSPRAANDIKTAVDQTVNYSRNPLSKEPTAETAFSAARKLIAGKIEKQVEAAGKALGDPKLAAALKEANRDYGFSKQIGNIASDRLNRVSANNAFGLSDRIAGGAGAAAAATISAASGDHDPAHMGGAALGAGLLAAGGNHLAQKYGNSVMAAGLNRAAPMAERTAGAINAGALGLLTPQVQRLLLLQELKKRGLVNPGLVDPGMQMTGETP